ncbi:quinol:cytochrome c oxidoreductase monoheme cytochrome subunit [Ulvibacter sp. MAR_2010_11]|uniref:c-type cytochrome n=1 Tax=Ulvibacter sp. MAR_2010_11 TaxID=1250229 RepID=UPI000C2B8807|nr:cytochrome c [Ulvibacter sp. MAR_2010_11]PKA83247.1 quinol:cytochrome c oxidoreductase monoheme cytochrome subunit [Ulvibacter sp. MAR_2010_11]
MKNSIHISIALVASVLMVSCFNNNKPNYQYMPNMYEPVGYETYGEYEVFPGMQEAMLPVAGSIPRGWQPYDYENTTAGLELARAELKNSLEVTEANLAAGAQLYTIYCAVCHGDKGDGQGILVEREKFLGIPSYADAGRNITEGSIYHVQMYGLNTMGSYASQTNELERWQITQHVMNLKAALKGEPALTVKTDSIAVVPTMVTDTIPSEMSTTSGEQH